MIQIPFVSRLVETLKNHRLFLCLVQERQRGMASRKCLLLVLVLLLTVSAFSAFPVRTLAEGGLECLGGAKVIVLSGWGGFVVTDTFELRNTGNVTLTAMALLIPKDAKNIEAFDGISSITYAVSERNESKAVDVTFRYPLRGIVGSSIFNDVYNLSVRYSLDSSTRVRKPSFDKLQLSTSLVTGISVVVPNWSVRVVLPEGASFESSVPTGTVNTEGLTTEVQFIRTNVTSGSLNVDLNYGYFPLWSIYRPAEWVGLAAIFVGAVVIVRRRRVRPEVRAGVKNVELIRSLADLVDEELGLWNEGNELDVALDNRSLARKDYNRRKATVEQRLRSVTASLSATKQKIRQTETQLVSVLDKIEAAEGEATAAGADLTRLRAQLRSGKLTRGTFEKLEAENRRRINRARSSLQSAVAELRDKVR